MKRIILIGLSLIMLLCSVSCTEISAEELSASFSRKTNEDGEITDGFITSSAELSFELFKRIATEDGENDLYSPISFLYCLGLIANGASGSTRTQIEDFLGCDIETLNRALYAFDEGIYTSDKCKVNIANSIWVQDGYPVKDSFLQTNADWYDSSVFKGHMPFNRSDIDDINNWCKKNTDGLIDKIIDTVPNIETRMYLINTLLFDAKWENKYEKNDIHDKSFTNANGSTSAVKMMYSDENVFIFDENTRGFIKNYSGGRYGFVALLPSEGTDIYEYIDSLSGKKWLSLMKGKRSISVSAGIPEFSYAPSKTEFREILQDMGVDRMFDDRLADFSEMSELPLKCDFISQKVFIDVSRNGTKAAAVTWGGMKDNAIMQEERVILDRPFVYAIVDNKTSLPLFIGAVLEL